MAVIELGDVVPAELRIPPGASRLELQPELFMDGVKFLMQLTVGDWRDSDGGLFNQGPIRFALVPGGGASPTVIVARHYRPGTRESGFVVDYTFPVGVETAPAAWGSSQQRGWLLPATTASARGRIA